MSLIDNLMEKVSPEPNSGCWIWLGGVTNGGYGVIKYRQKQRLAHRVSYEIFVGPIPQGLEIDHLCRVRCCINPKHLEAVTRSKNFQRSPLFGRYNAEKTHCPLGHEYTGDNTYRSKGRRSCKKCHQEHYHSKKAHK